MSPLGKYGMCEFFSRPICRTGNENYLGNNVRFTLFSSLVSALHRDASCLVTSCLLGSAPISELVSATTTGLCSWQNWKNALHGFFGAFGSRSGWKYLNKKTNRYSFQLNKNFITKRGNHTLLTKIMVTHMIYSLLLLRKLFKHNQQ